MSNPLSFYLHDDEDDFDLQESDSADSVGIWNDFLMNDFSSNQKTQEPAGIRLETISPVPTPELEKQDLKRNDSDATLYNLTQDLQNANLASALATLLQNMDKVPIVSQTVLPVVPQPDFAQPDFSQALPPVEIAPTVTRPFQPPWTITEPNLIRTSSGTILNKLANTHRTVSAPLPPSVFITNATRPRSQSATTHRPTIQALCDLPIATRKVLSGSSMDELNAPIETKPASPAPPLNVKMECTNCHTTKTPIWRKSSDGEWLCNACGLFERTHKRHRIPPPVKKEEEVDEPLPTCYNCGTQTTPLWRRNDHGQTQCNACGIYEKHHGRRRPLRLNQTRRKPMSGAFATLGCRKKTF